MRQLLIATLGLSSLLTACATHSPSLPPAIDTPKPVAVDPRLCQPAVPEPPVEGGIVTPANDAERAATEAFLNSEAEARRWGRYNAGLVELARRTLCG